MGKAIGAPAIPGAAFAPLTGGTYRILSPVATSLNGFAAWENILPWDTSGIGDLTYANKGNGGTLRSLL